jgi:uncharacterized protein YdeI (YjbR/CyaY-like superfamily)
MVGVKNKCMTKKTTTNPIHKVPTDLKEVFISNPTVLEKWNSLTPLARNEWICWITIVKKAETRKEHIERLQQDLLNGKRRPCCWPGCPHRNTKAAKWFKR